MNDMYERV